MGRGDQGRDAILVVVKKLLSEVNVTCGLGEEVLLVRLGSECRESRGG